MSPSVDLNFQIDAAEPQRGAAEPLLLFRLRLSENVADGARPTPIQSIVLRCQVRIEPARRTYLPAQRARLLDLFGTPERWGQTVRPMLWTHLSVAVPPFEATGLVDLPVPCSFDFNLAATKYFAALDEGDLPLCFLFSGTIFYQSDDGALQIAQIPWEKEATFRLPATTWQRMMGIYYPNKAWIDLRKDVFDRLFHYRSHHGLPTWDEAMDRLLSAAEEPVTP